MIIIKIEVQHWKKIKYTHAHTYSVQSQTLQALQIQWSQTPSRTLRNMQFVKKSINIAQVDRGKYTNRVIREWKEDKSNTLVAKCLNGQRGPQSAFETCWNNGVFRTDGLKRVLINKSSTFEIKTLLFPCPQKAARNNGRWYNCIIRRVLSIATCY